MFWAISWLHNPQDFDAEEKGASPANVASNVSADADLRGMSEGILNQALTHSTGQLLDAPMHSSGRQICSTLQFSLQDLQKRRQQRLAQIQSNNGLCQRTKKKRSLN